MAVAMSIDDNKAVGNIYGDVCKTRLIQWELLNSY